MLPIRKSFSGSVEARCYELLDIDPETPDAEEQLETELLKLIAMRDAMHHATQQSQKDNERLQHYLDQLIHDIASIKRSRAWRIGYQLMSVAKRLLGRRSGGDGFAHIEAIIERYQHWKKARD